MAVQGISDRQSPNEADWSDFIHTGPGALAGRYLRLFWQPIYRSDDLLPGRAVPIRIMGEDFTLYRGGQSGVPHLLAFRCAHRGTQLSTGWVEGDNVRCFYHGWKYDASGQCIEQPAEPEPFCQRIRVPAYPTFEYLGLIFAYVGQGAAPPPPHYELFDQEGVVTNGTEHLGCSYFNRMDNSADPVHTKFVHRWPDYGRYGLVGIPKIWAEEREWGLSTYITWPQWSQQEVDIHHVLMPNVLMNRIDRGLHIAWRVPVTDESCLVFNVALSPSAGEAARSHGRGGAASFEAHTWGEAVLAGSARIEEVLQANGVGSMGRFNLQDYVAQVGQGPMVDHTQERLGRTDVGITLLRGLWARELRALDEGSALTRWRTERAGLAEWGPDAGQPTPSRARI